MEHEEDIQAEWSSSELSILRSAELDIPPHGSVERTLTALGVGAALSASASLGTASAVATATHAGRMAHGTLWLKWLAAAAVGGGLMGAFFLLKHGEKAKVPSALRGPVTVAPAAPPPVPANLPSVAAAEAPSAAPVAPAPAPSVVAQAAARTDSSAKPESSDALAAEIRMIDEARDRLRHGDAHGSLETLARYDELVKRGGSMRAEAAVVRIEAYQASGDSARATALGQRFLTKNPNSPYADYVKRVLARTP
jgi:hypothetical protein